MPRKKVSHSFIVIGGIFQHQQGYILGRKDHLIVALVVAAVLQHS
jgi:hypothetical protein